MKAAPEVEPGEARRRADDGALLLDVREADEWDAGRVADSVWIPMGEFRARLAEIPKDREIVVVCRSGSRSANVAAGLLARGYDAVNLAGGLVAWTAAGIAFDGDVA